MCNISFNVQRRQGLHLQKVLEQHSGHLFACVFILIEIKNHLITTETLACCCLINL